MISISSIGRRKRSISVCYLIDINFSFIGGGQKHLMNIVHQMKTQNSKLKTQIHVFGGPSSDFFIRCFWMLSVIPKVIFHHFFCQRFDLIHAHSIPAMISGKILSLSLHIPIVVTVHGAWMKNWVERFVLTQIKYDAQITVSRDFLKFRNVNRPKYIPNGVDMEVFKGLASHMKSRTLGGKEMILFVGRKNDFAKGFEILQEAMIEVKNLIPNAKLIVAGGNVPHLQLVELYKQANLFVLPSLSEGFPLTLLEAWASYLPVVATRVGEIPYLIRDGINGFLAPPGDSKQLAYGILRALKSKNLEKIAENGYNLSKGYTWEKITQKTLGVYQKICWTSLHVQMIKRRSRK